MQDFVERQIAMRTKNAGRLLREDALSRIRLSNLDKSDMKIMRELIRKLAKRWLTPFAAAQKRSAAWIFAAPCEPMLPVMASCSILLGGVR